MRIAYHSKIDHRNGLKQITHPRGYMNCKWLKYIQYIFKLSTKLLFNRLQQTHKWLCLKKVDGNGKRVAHVFLTMNAQQNM